MNSFRRLVTTANAHYEWKMAKNEQANENIEDEREMPLSRVNSHSLEDWQGW